VWGSGVRVPSAPPVFLGQITLSVVASRSSGPRSSCARRRRRAPLMRRPACDAWLCARYPARISPWVGGCRVRHCWRWFIRVAPVVISGWQAVRRLGDRLAVLSGGRVLACEDRWAGAAVQYRLASCVGHGRGGARAHGDDAAGVAQSDQSSRTSSAGVTPSVSASSQMLSRAMLRSPRSTDPT
jgi:hypothetical protein